MSAPAPAPIAVFDSGVGGLTVVRAIRDHLGPVAIRYLGDTARLPYGTKSPSTVRRYAESCVRVLESRGPLSALVIACNTASAHARAELAAQLESQHPVIGVIEPGARWAARSSKTGRIGVIATEGTVRSGRYSAAILEARPDAVVVEQPAPLLVPLAEEGYASGPVVEAVLDDHLRPFADAGIDRLVLGCTHYPYLREAIAGWFERRDLPIEILDSAWAAALELGERCPAGADYAEGPLEILCTDAAERFGRVAARFLGEPVELQTVDL